ncbi:hypothetical protein K7X08_032632 [Anisodus acutangulus]|uniref:Uncharacterized protein n=1 Tax=Anisodus acutangulus TaxID=402998 RepID=A0A9Q1M1V1_9SOLA|nr:hypothetical protein K7X08_032632 [Anisodus acutangulus]
MQNDTEHNTGEQEISHPLEMLSKYHHEGIPIVEQGGLIPGEPPDRMGSESSTEQHNAERPQDFNKAKVEIEKDQQRDEHKNAAEQEAEIAVSTASNVQEKGVPDIEDDIGEDDEVTNTCNTTSLTSN